MSLYELKSLMWKSVNWEISNLESSLHLKNNWIIWLLWKGTYLNVAFSECKNSHEFLFCFIFHCALLSWLVARKIWIRWQDSDIKSTKDDLINYNHAKLYHNGVMIQDFCFCKYKYVQNLKIYNVCYQKSTIYLQYRKMQPWSFK